MWAIYSLINKFNGKPIFFGESSTETSDTLYWANGDNADKTITIDIINDGEVEDDETFIVSGIHWLQAPPN
ncbi:MAG: hypothetical protein ABFS56_07425 [Pseudomonadota bacterium]